MKKRGLLLKFGITFLIFSVVTLAISGYATFAHQTRIYQESQEKNLQNIASYLEILLDVDGMDFTTYQKYFMEHCDEMDVPIDFDEEDVVASRQRFESMFVEECPGKVLGLDISFSELSPQLQNAYAVYYHEYYLLTFEKAQETFGLSYAYYIVPAREPFHMCYVLDAVREGREDNPDMIELGITILQPLNEHGKMWEAWDTGKTSVGYDVYDNEFGKTYGWYMPVYINGEKLGLVGTEVEIADYNKAIANNTLRQVGSVSAVLLIAVGITLFLIYKLHITRITELSDQIGQYAREKDPAIAGQIRQKGHDEITALSKETASMIVELDTYMKNLVKTTEELDQTREDAARDALTGVFNRKSYDEEIKRLEWELRDGKTDFGIAVVDMNYLKRINDTYGHEQGNIAIQTCCRLISRVFANSPVFRIGGDEFAVILENQDFKDIESLTAQFNEQLERLGEDSSMEIWERISAALGYALYDPVKDDCATNVFKRADRSMYLRKTEMKNGSPR